MKIFIRLSHLYCGHLGPPSSECNEPYCGRIGMVPLLRSRNPVKQRKWRREEERVSPSPFPPSPSHSVSFSFLLSFPRQLWLMLVRARNRMAWYCTIIYHRATGTSLDTGAIYLDCSSMNQPHPSHYLC